MSKGFETPLHVPLRSDRHLIRASLFAHWATTAVVLWTPMPIWLLIALCVALLVSFRYHRDLHARRCRPGALIALRHHADGSWTLYRRHAPTVQGARTCACFVHHRCVILSFSTAGWRRQRVVITEGGTDPTAFRRLRVRLLSQHRLGPVP